jgi:hypothetical protein
MPNNKKKKGGKKGSNDKAERAANLARRAEKNRPMDINSLPNFPCPETHEQSLERILSYKYLSSNTEGSDRPVSVSLVLKTNDSVLRKQEYTTNDMEELEEKFVDYHVKDSGFFRKAVLPDYDRNAATYPVARKIMGGLRVADLTRHATKRAKDVPVEQLDAYNKFVERGGNIQVDCTISNEMTKAGIPMDSGSIELLNCKELGLNRFGKEIVGDTDPLAYCCRVKLLGEDYGHDNSYSFSIFLW